MCRIPIINDITCHVHGKCYLHTVKICKPVSHFNNPSVTEIEVYCSHIIILKNMLLFLVHYQI